MAFPDTAVFSRTAGIEARAVDRAAVLVNPAQHDYFGVNRVGARIWALLEQPRRVSEIVSTLLREFAVDEAVCRRETEAFLTQLLARKMIARQDR